MQSLWPDAPGELSDDDLLEWYAYPAGGSWLRANFVSTLDGAVQGPDRRAGSISPEADQHLFRLLRTLADVVVAGAGTARAEHYAPVTGDEVSAQRRESLGLAPAPALAIASRSLDLSPELIRGGRAPTIVITTSDAPLGRREEIEQQAPVIVAGTGSIDFAAALDQLGGRGYQRMLCEGGPHLLHSLLVADQVDELCLSWSPLVIGGDGLRLVAGDLIDPMVSWRPRHLLEADGTLFARYVVERH